MPTVYALLPDHKVAALNANGNPASGYQLFVYVAGSSTKATTYTESDGVTPNANPIVLDSRGEPSNGVYVESGTYKLVLATDTDTDPPASPVWTRDNVSPINDTSVVQSEWVASGLTPTYVSASSFTVTGDQTSAFHVGRRLKLTDSGGTDYGTISASAYTSLTTVTVTLDSGSIDSGLSAVSYGLLSADSSSLPHTKSDSDGLTLTGELALAGEPNTALDALPLRDLATFITGLGLSNDSDADHDIAIATGVAADSTGVAALRLAAVMTKQIDASWAVGDDAGGLFSGAVANTTWYHVFLIEKDSDGSVDAGFDTSITAANIPAGYTKYRRIGSVLTDGTANILAFAQFGDEVLWSAPVNDVDTTNPGTSAVTSTLSVPPDVQVLALITATVEDSSPSATTNVLITSPDQADTAPSTTIRDITLSASSAQGSGVEKRVRTSTSKQIRYRLSNSDAGVRFNVTTHGWLDYRGRCA